MRARSARRRRIRVFPPRQASCSEAAIAATAAEFDIMPDGYGFLRSTQFSWTTTEITGMFMLSASQIRRFSLRTGDMVTGKTRPGKEGSATARFFI